MGKAKAKLLSNVKSSIGSSELFLKWVEYLKSIFGSDEKIWYAVESSTNNRQFTNAMKSYGFKTRRRSIGIFYEGIEYRKEATESVGDFSGFDYQNIFETLPKVD